MTNQTKAETGVEESIKKVLNRIATIPQRDFNGMAYVPTDELVYEMKESLYIFFKNQQLQLQQARETWLRSEIEWLEGEKEVTDCIVGEGNPVGIHEYIEPSNWRSECRYCGKEKNDNENTEKNKALQTIQARYQKELDHPTTNNQPEALPFNK